MLKLNVLKMASFIMLGILGGGLVGCAAPMETATNTVKPDTVAIAAVPAPQVALASTNTVTNTVSVMKAGYRTSEPVAATNTQTTNNVVIDNRACSLSDFCPMPLYKRKSPVAE